MQTANDLLAQPFATMPDLVRAHALERPDHPAIIDGAQVVTFSELDAKYQLQRTYNQRRGKHKYDEKLRRKPPEQS